MTIFKNVTRQWLPAGTLGPFQISEKIPDDEAHIVRCRAADVCNIRGSDVVRFEPPELLFTTSNSTESHVIEMFIHASFPKEQVGIPSAECDVVSRTLLHADNDSAEIGSPSSRNNRGPGDADDSNWLLMAHFVPSHFSYGQGFPKDSIYAWKCSASTEGTRVRPPEVIVDETNYTDPPCMALQVHNSVPDDQPIHQPNCEFVVVKNGAISSKKQRLRYDDRRDAVLSSWLALAMLVGAVVYFVQPSWKEQKRKPVKEGRPLKAKNGKKIKRGLRKQSLKNQSSPSTNSNKPRPTRATTTSASPISLSDVLLEDDESSVEEDYNYDTTVNGDTNSEPSHIIKGPAEESRSSPDGWTTVGKENSSTKFQTKKTFWTRFIFKRPQKQSNMKKADYCKPSYPKKAVSTATPNIDLLNTTATNIITDKPNDENDAGCEEREQVDRLLAECAQQEPLIKDESYSFTLYVVGMTCQGCETVVKNTLENLNDITSVTVSWKDTTATIVSPIPRLDLMAVSEAIDAVGFEIFMGGTALTEGGYDLQSTPGVEATKSDTKPLRPPPGFSAADRESSLSLMDQLRAGSVPIRRYRCRCGEAECICSAHPVHSDDLGQEVSLGDLCRRIESNLVGGLHGVVGDYDNRPTSLEDWIVSSNGGSGEFRAQLASMPIPCGCGSEHGGSDNEL